MISSDKLISKYGVDCVVTAVYYLTEGSDSGASSIVLHDTEGLEVDMEILLGEETAVISSIDITAKTIEFATPLEDPHDMLDHIDIISNIKGVHLIRGKDITRQLIDYTHKMRVSTNLIINYGSLFDYINRHYMVTGIDPSDQTKVIKITEINQYIDIIRKDSVTESEFGYDRRPRVVYSNIPAYIEHIGSGIRSDPMVFLPNTYRSVLIPKAYPLVIGDIVKFENTNFRVTGIDYNLIRNFNRLMVDLAQDMNNEEGVITYG